MKIYVLFFEIQTKSGKWIPSPNNGECGARLTSEQVSGVGDVKLGEFPYMASLGYLLDGDMRYLCGGSVLNEKYVLTAAHCHIDERKIRYTSLFKSIIKEKRWWYQIQATF